MIAGYDAASIENLTIENAQSGEIYVLLVTNYSNQQGTIQIEQTNAGQTGAGSTVAEISVELGSDQTFVDSQNMKLWLTHLLEIILNGTKMV